ncbi:MAG TPA: carboxypeptidase regulatory-like domain-containing protein [Chloroflexota bacterium]|nr:carboxypeptidase regulatory-like domain-containing protein [Chloroflexota bacterium]
MSVSLRMGVAGLLAYGSLLPVVASADTRPSTGTLVGQVTCGAAEDAPAAYVVVAVEGVNVQTHTDSAGRFLLTGVPVAANLTIDAVAGPDFVASRYNVSVQAGQTLDIGSMDLAACPQIAPPAPADDQPGESQQNEN